MAKVWVDNMLKDIMNNPSLKRGVTYVKENILSVLILFEVILILFLSLLAIHLLDIVLPTISYVYTSFFFLYGTAVALLDGPVKKSIETHAVFLSILFLVLSGGFAFGGTLLTAQIFHALFALSVLLLVVALALGYFKKTL